MNLKYVADAVKSRQQVHARVRREVLKKEREATRFAALKTKAEVRAARMQNSLKQFCESVLRGCSPSWCVTVTSGFVCLTLGGQTIRLQAEAWVEQRNKIREAYTMERSAPMAVLSWESTYSQHQRSIAEALGTAIAAVELHVTSQISTDLAGGKAL